MKTIIFTMLMLLPMLASAENVRLMVSITILLLKAKLPK